MCGRILRSVWISYSTMIFYPVVLAPPNKSSHLQFNSGLLPIYFSLFPQFWIPVTISYFSPTSRLPGIATFPPTLTWLWTSVFMFSFRLNSYLQSYCLSLFFLPVFLPTTRKVLSPSRVGGSGDIYWAKRSYFHLGMPFAISALHTFWRNGEGSQQGIGRKYHSVFCHERIPRKIKKLFLVRFLRLEVISTSCLNN